MPRPKKSTDSVFEEHLKNKGSAKTVNTCLGAFRRFMACYREKYGQGKTISIFLDWISEKRKPLQERKPRPMEARLRISLISARKLG